MVEGNIGLGIKGDEFTVEFSIIIDVLSCHQEQPSGIIDIVKDL